MAKVTIKNNGKTININPAVSLLNNLLINDVPIETICGGKAICGKCVVSILKGKEFLSPLKEREQLRVKSLKLKDSGNEVIYRLACQTYIRRDVTIEILNFKG